MSASPNTPRWYLIQTKPRQEARAEEHLCRQQFECYRPVKAVPDGRSRTEEALFPGYLFIRLDANRDNWYPIRSTRGVSRIVSFGGSPTAVQDALIEQLRQRLAMSDPDIMAPDFKLGDRVQINGGSFKEIEAIFLSRDGEERAVILLNLLQREQKVSVPTRYLHGYA